MTPAPAFPWLAMIGWSILSAIMIFVLCGIAESILYLVIHPTRAAARARIVEKAHELARRVRSRVMRRRPHAATDVTDPPLVQSVNVVIISDFKRGFGGR